MTTWYVVRRVGEPPSSLNSARPSPDSVASLSARFRQEAANLANITGSSSRRFEARMEATGQSLRETNGR
jgi:hypothetical protein